MYTLFKLSAVKVMDFAELRYLFDQVESTIRSLKPVGITPESYESFVAPLFMSKLPNVCNELKLDINKRLPASETSETSETEWKLEQLLDALKKELQLREKCNFVPSSSDKGDKSSSLRQRSFQPPTAATLYTENQEKHDQFTPSCVFCKGKHRANQCNVVTDVVTGERLLRQKACCFLCLREGHIMRYCKNQLYKCAICHGKHNISICEGNDRLPQPPKKQPLRGVVGETKVSLSSVPKPEEVFRKQNKLQTRNKARIQSQENGHIYKIKIKTWSMYLVKLFDFEG